MKKVWKVNENDTKILKYLFDNREGLRIKTLMKLCNLKTSVLYKRLNILRENGFTENIFPVWKLSNGGVAKCEILNESNNIFELHNISYVVKLLKVPDWWSKRKNYLIRLKEWQFKNIDFGKGNTNPYQQLINENFVIQCYPESIIIIAKKRYYSNDPYSTIKAAINDVVGLLEWFCECFKFNFWLNEVPHIEIRNNDFNRIKDYMANQIKDNKGSFLVEIDKRRKVWVDMSEPFGKEANYPEAQVKLEKLTKDILTKESLLPSEVTQLVGDLAKNQLNQTTQLESFAIALNKHIPAYEGMTKIVGRLEIAINKLNKRLSQTRLSEYL
jgi:hypothetical protein